MRYRKVFDPEAIKLTSWGAGKSYPILKFYSIGVNISL
jgi:hypothetical protein